MQTPAKRRRNKCGLKFSNTKQLKRARMGKRLCRVEESDTETAKILVFKDTKPQPFIVGDENLEVVSEIMEEVTASKYKDETQHSKLASAQASHYCF